MRGEPVRWALLGASLIADSRIAPAIRADTHSELVGVMSASAERRERFAARHGLSTTYSSLEEALADASVDAVYISTTNDLHAQQTIAAADAGKHVLCEKPMALTLDDAFAMRDACAGACVLLAVNHNKRYAATHRTMRRLVGDGTIGTPLAARVFFSTSLPPDQRTWRLSAQTPGAGVIFDLTVHDADLLRFLLQDEVAAVAAFATQQGLALGDVEDSAMGLLRFRSGLLACLHDAFTLPHAGTGVELHGSDGSLVAVDVMGDDPVGEVLLRRNGVGHAVDVGLREDLFEQAIASFVRAIRDDRDAAIATGDDGIRSLAVALAARESVSRGQVVEIATLDDRLAGTRLRPQQHA